MITERGKGKFSAVVRNESDRIRVIRLIEARQVSEDKPVEIVVGPYKRNRSAEQNALYRVWLSEIAEATGHTTEELHEDFKRRYVAFILQRDDPKFAQIVEDVKDLRRAGRNDEADKWRGHLLGLLSTTSLNVGQFTELLENVERFAADMGIILTAEKP